MHPRQCLAHGKCAMKLAEVAFAVGFGRKVSFCWVGFMGVEERVLEREVWRPTSSWSHPSVKVSAPQGRKLSPLSSSGCSKQHLVSNQRSTNSRGMNGFVKPMNAWIAPWTQPAEPGELLETGILKG